MGKELDVKTSNLKEQNILSLKCSGSQWKIEQEFQNELKNIGASFLNKKKRAIEFPEKFDEVTYSSIKYSSPQ